MLKIRTTMPEFYCIFCYIRNVSIEDGKIIKNNNQFFRKMSIPQGKFLDIVNLILITTLNTLDSEFYEQTDGNAMGGAASSPTAEIYIYMQAMKRMQCQIVLNIPKILERFYYEILCILKFPDLKNFFLHISNHCPLASHHFYNGVKK